MPNPNGAVSGNAQNLPEAHVPRTRSTFPLHYHLFNTHRFGEYIPHYVEDLNKDERFPIHSSGTVRSYTLKSPLMQNIKRNKDYFLVPMESILPNNWEKFFDNPVRGDDVLDDVGPSVDEFWSQVAAFMTSNVTAWQSTLNAAVPDIKSIVQALLRFLIIGEYFYSNGNLMASLGCHGAPYFTGDDNNGDPLTWDDVFDRFLNRLSAYLQTHSISFSCDGYSYVLYGNDNAYGFPSVSLHHALQLFRDNPTFVITNVAGTSTDVSDLISDFKAIDNTIVYDFVAGNVPFDTSRLWAYQLCCAHYFTNDHIDFVYSAELFRQLIGNYLRRASTASNYWINNSSFTRNGVVYEYDFLSAHYFTVILSLLTSAQPLTGTSDVTNCRLGYLSALFGYRRSLRYLDYFTGSRSQPLAVSISGGVVTTDVQVVSNRVSVIDITKSIQAQRFLNSVNRVRHSFEGYLKGIFGGKLPAPDYHNPFYVAHTDDVIFGQETENTATEQMTDSIAITTNLRGKSGNYMFEVESDRPCIAIGITSYEIPRVYGKSMERSFLKLNRFDWFNPFMQYIGDQPIYTQELGIRPGSSSLNTLNNFSYTLRHMEYKQRYNQCAGAFVNDGQLSKWIFQAKDRRGTQANINPDWIRALNAELDDFYVSLSGFSLGYYFHFIVDDYNSCDASRPMAYAPQILG